MKNFLIKVGSKIPYFFYALVLVFAFFGLSSKYSLPGGYKVFTVMSGSMQPKIKTGSLILVQKQGVYKVGDVITFVLPKNKNTVTHRIVSIDIETTGTNKVGKYKTRGDANDSPDNEQVLKEDIVGKVLFSIPLLGYPISFSKTLTGLVILIVVPATLIIYTELMAVKSEIKKLLAERKDFKTAEKEALASVEKVESADDISKKDLKIKKKKRKKKE